MSELSSISSAIDGDAARAEQAVAAIAAPITVDLKTVLTHLGIMLFAVMLFGGGIAVGHLI